MRRILDTTQYFSGLFEPEIAKKPKGVPFRSTAILSILGRAFVGQAHQNLCRSKEDRGLQRTRNYGRAVPDGAPRLEANQPIVTACERLCALLGGGAGPHTYQVSLGRI